MVEILIKVVVTSVLVVTIAEVAKHSTFFGALIASLPLTSILAMIWLYADTKDLDKISNFSYGVFWLVIPSLILFIALPVLLKSGLAFAPSLLVASGLTISGYFAMVYLLKFFDITI